MTRKTGIFTFVLIAAAMASTAVQAHPGAGAGAGFVHPFGGIDHILALLAVGLWAGLSKGATRVAVPAAFLAAMIAGAALAMSGIRLPGIETGIAVSLVVFGLLVVAALRLGPAAGAAVAAGFALFHGAAHGAEMAGAGALVYIAGFSAATLAIQLSGIGLATLLSRVRAAAVARAAGAVTAVSGLALALG